MFNVWYVHIVYYGSVREQTQNMAYVVEDYLISFHMGVWMNQHISNMKIKDIIKSHRKVRQHCKNNNNGRLDPRRAYHWSHSDYYDEK